MSKAAAKADETEAPPKKSKKLLIIIIAVVVLLALVAGGAAFFMLNKKKGDEEHAEAKPAELAPPKKIDRSKPPVYVTLEPFTNNLAPEGGSERFVQMVAVIKLVDAKFEPDLKLHMPELRHRINLLLVSKKPSELSTMEGREILSEEILIEANDVLGFPPAPPRRNAPPPGPVESVLFNSLIIQ